MGQQRIVTDIPEDHVAFVVAMLEADRATVTKRKQPNGLWEITGTFPDVPQMPATLLSASRTHDVDVLARTIWGEARGGAKLGMEAVAAVVLNRLKRNRPERFGSSVSDVCLKPLQFSCWNEGDPNLSKMQSVTEVNPQFRLCLEIAGRAMQGVLADPVTGSDHYHTTGVAPLWSQGRVPVRQIDSHLFYNNIP